MTPCDVLAVGAHPDDAELGCGATLARLATAGRRVAILDLTAGELGTRGDVEVRADEADAAGRALGVSWRHCLGLPDGGLDGGHDGQLAAVVRVVRAAVPRVVLLPDARDPHPDHAATAALVRRATFLAGVGKYGAELGAPWRPRLLLAYPGPRQQLTVDLVVDVTSVYARKRAALAAHASQFDPATGGTPTHLASGHFLAAIEGRDRMAGGSVGVEFGEGFVGCGAIPADVVAWLFGDAGADCGFPPPDPAAGGQER